MRQIERHMLHQNKTLAGVMALTHQVSGCYKSYVGVIKRILLYWANFHRDRHPAADDTNGGLHLIFQKRTTRRDY